jgi:hypothetical protein
MLLYEIRAGETDKFLKHLDILKLYQVCLNKFPNTEFQVYDMRFKSIISASLLPFGQYFVIPYNANANDLNDPDPKRRMTANAFIGLLHIQYKICVNRINHGNNENKISSTHLVTTQMNASSSKSLAAQIADTKSNMKPYHDFCKHAGHWTGRCQKNPANKCYNCRKLGHHARDCWVNKKDKDKDEDKTKGKETARNDDKNKDQSNIIEKQVTFVIDREAYNFHTYEVYNAGAINDHLIYYDWLADNATTSHMFCERDAFTTYIPQRNISITVVGEKEAMIAGCRTVNLILTCNSHKYL